MSDAPPAADRAEAAREDILRHAEDLFAHYGYGKTNIGDIARRTQMSPGNLYRYFRNKQAIGEEVVRRHMAGMEARLSEATPGAEVDAETRLRAFFAAGISGTIALVKREPKVVELAAMICAGQSGILTRHLDWKRGQIREIVEAGNAAGAFRVADPQALSETLMDATASFWNPQTLADYDAERVPLRVGRILDLSLAAMRAGM